ncbi:MAG: AraC family transcriptional regulator [Verrucomicrobiota bacterium]|nr:AraC family transcriptional regulator [Verrucomicrobiota bacterium]
MEPGSFGFTWKHNTEVKPALVTAWRAVRRMGVSCFKWKYPVWVVDYAFNEVELVRVGSRARPWRRRQARAAHLYPPDTVFWEDYPARADPVSHCAYVLFLEGEACGLANLVHPRAGYARFTDPDGLLGPMLEDIARIGHKNGELGFWKAQARFCSLLDLLLHSEPVENETRRIRNSPPAEDSSDLVRAANAYLEENAAKRVELSAMARHLRVSVSTLSHRYRREAGESPMNRLLRLRVNLAKALIVKGQSLKSVAESIGFSDAFHLSKTFKRMEGLSPKAYLQSLRRADRGRD